MFRKHYLVDASPGIRFVHGRVSHDLISDPAQAKALDRSAIVDRFHMERRSVAHGDETVEVLPGLTRRCSSGRWHEISFTCLTSETADSEIVRQMAHFQALDAGFEWKVFASDSPADLRERLEAHGFEVGAREALVVYDLEGAPERLIVDSKCQVERIVRVEQIAEFRFVAEAVFGKDYRRTSDELAAAIRSGSTGQIGYVGYIGGEPARIGRLYTDSNSAFGGLYGGATLEQFRGLGCYRAIVAARARDAKCLGARYILVDALPTSLPILLRLGFEHIDDSWPCTFGRAH